MSRIITPRRGLILPSKRLQRGSMLVDAFRFGSGGGDPYFSSVVSLLHFEGADGSTTFTDEKGKTWARNGTQTEIRGNQLFVANGYGASTNAGIKTASSTDFDFGTADFTIEWFQNFNNSGEYQNIFDRGGGSAGAIVIQTGFGDGKYAVYVSNTIVCSESSAATAGVLQHHALCKDSGVMRKYRNGVQTGSGSSATSISNTAPATWGAYENGTYATPSKLDDCRITKGVCRYPGGTTFTVPARPFPDS